MFFESGKKVKIIYNPHCEWCCGEHTDCKIHDGKIKTINNLEVIFPGDKIKSSFYDTEGIYWRGRCCKLLDDNKTLMETE